MRVSPHVIKLCLVDGQGAEYQKETIYIISQFQNVKNLFVVQKLHEKA